MWPYTPTGGLSIWEMATEGASSDRPGQVLSRFGQENLQEPSIMDLPYIVIFQFSFLGQG